MRSRAASLRCWIWRFSPHSRDRLALLEEKLTDNADERRPFVAGCQWLATAEVAEVVIAPIVFSFIKPLCRCLTLGISV